MKTVWIMLAIVLATMLTVQVPATPKLSLHTQTFSKNIPLTFASMPCGSFTISLAFFNEIITGRDTGSTLVHFTAISNGPDFTISENISSTAISHYFDCSPPFLGFGGLVNQAVGIGSGITFRVLSSGNFTITTTFAGFNGIWYRIYETWTETTIS